MRNFKKGGSAGYQGWLLRVSTILTGHSVPHSWEEGELWLRQVGGIRNSILFHPLPLCDAEKVENYVLNNNILSNYQTVVTFTIKISNPFIVCICSNVSKANS